MKTSFIILRGEHFADIEHNYLFKNEEIEKLVSEIIGKPFSPVSYENYIHKDANNG